MWALLQRVALLCSMATAASCALRAQSAPQFRFVCQTGYSRILCSEHTDAFQALLARLQPPALRQHWTWVMVPRGAWPDLMRKLGHHPATTAVTLPELHETWFDGELFGTPSVRQFELREHWHTDIAHLREYTISHELAHIVCTPEAVNENEANQIAERIRAKTDSPCFSRKRPQRDQLQTAHAAYSQPQRQMPSASPLVARPVQ